MVLLAFPTSYAQLGTPSPTGLVNFAASGWAGGGTVISTQPSGGSFASGSGDPLVSGGINFASETYYVPSGGFTNFNSSSGAFYGLPFDNGILRLLTSGSLANKLLTFEKPPPPNLAEEIAKIFNDISAITYQYSRPPSQSQNQGGDEQKGDEQKNNKRPPGLES